MDDTVIIADTPLMPTGNIIDGAELAADFKTDVVKPLVEKLAEEGVTPKLAVILVGNNPASQTYVKMKKADCLECGIVPADFALPEDTPPAALCGLIEELNNDDSITGILVQLPLPQHFDVEEVFDCMSPEKDVDGLTPYNMGKLLRREPGLNPCTPFGIIMMLYAIDTDFAGKHAVVVGRSNIVGNPVAQLLLGENATVTIAHSCTTDLAAITRQADILIAATGVAGLITAEHIKPGATVIDVGMNRDKKGNLVGDVDFAAASKVAQWITPVPGGVGPVTRAMLLYNTAILAQCQHLADLED